MNLVQYYNNFIENGIIDLENIITNALECELRINQNFSQEENIQNFNILNRKLEYEDLERIGIRKPGHIYKILTRIEFDAKLINQNLAFFVKSQIQNFESNNYENNNLNTNNINHNNLDVTNSTGSLRISGAKMVCCSYKNKNVTSKNNNDFDFQKFLEKHKLKKNEKNFIYNGFDSLEYVFLQFFSVNYKFNEELLETKLHIYDSVERKKVLICLIKELKEINNKIGLNLNLHTLQDSTQNSFYDEENLNFYDDRKVEDGCKACVIF